MDERWEAKRETAQAAGAAAVLAVEGEDLAKDLVTEPPAASFFLPFDAPDEAPPLVHLSPAAARALLAAAGLDAASAPVAKPRESPGVTITFRASGSERLAWSRNVIGFLAGSDATLRDEAACAHRGVRQPRHDRPPVAAGGDPESRGGHDATRRRDVPGQR